MEKRTFTPEYKTKIVLEILRENKTLSEIGAREKLAVTQLSAWKREFLGNASTVFATARAEKESREKQDELQEREKDLMAKVGQLTIEVDWLKKKSAQVLGSNWEIKTGFKK